VAMGGLRVAVVSSNMGFDFGRVKRRSKGRHFAVFRISNTRCALAHPHSPGLRGLGCQHYAARGLASGILLAARSGLPALRGERSPRISPGLPGLGSQHSAASARPAFLLDCPGLGSQHYAARARPRSLPGCPVWAPSIGRRALAPSIPRREGSPPQSPGLPAPARSSSYGSARGAPHLIQDPCDPPPCESRDLSVSIPLSEGRPGDGRHPGST
jgi:hypothetical protein